MHSVIIGIALGTISDSKWKTLLIALVFHQLFEGMALGSRISELAAPMVTKVLLWGLLYPITTPMGVATGIGIRSVFNANAQGAIVAQGVFDGLSCVKPFW